MGDAMKLKDDLGLPARSLYFIMGVVLAIATVAAAFSQWPMVVAGKASPLSLVLLLLIAIPLALFIIIWAIVGRHREWRIGEDHIRVRLLSLTSWHRDFRIHPEQIETINRQQYSYDDKQGRVSHAITVTLRDGRTLESPVTFDAGQADQAWQKLEGLCKRGQFSG
jgi:hypothetical protein